MSKSHVKTCVSHLCNFINCEATQEVICAKAHKSWNFPTLFTKRKSPALSEAHSLKGIEYPFFSHFLDKSKRFLDNIAHFSFLVKA